MRLLKVVLAVVMFLFFVVAMSAFAADDYCYKGSEPRGAGTVPGSCASNQDRDAGLCYDKCPAGFKGVGPVCWQQCGEGYHDDGATCRRDAHIFGKDSYGRGAGYSLIHHKKCEKDEGRSCEKYGALYYPTCRDGYDNVGCCICRQNRCPDGYKDDGATCRRDVHIYAKKSQGRGVGKVGECESGKVKDAGLCYKECKKGYKGVGPVCWNTCPSGYVDCGAGCSTSKLYCAEVTGGQVTNTLMLAVNIATLGSSGAAEAGVGTAEAAEKASKLALKIKEAKEAWAKIKNSDKYIALMRTEKGAAYAHNMEKLANSSNTEEALRNASAFDPTGISQVVNSFTHKICNN